MNERAQGIARKISERELDISAAVGFDGYIDELLRVVEKGDNRTGYAFYKDITAFASRLAAAAGKSADLEIVPIDIKLGGNAPIMANALAQLGVRTTCIGAMGYPKLQEVFAEMAERCSCVSICDPAFTHALEFNDGKVMLANVKSLEQLNWDRMKELLGLAYIMQLLEAADLIGLVNWSGVSGSSDIWAGIYREVLPSIKKGKRQFFFDLADPSKKSRDEILAVFKLIRGYAEYGQVVLGLNENEAIRIHAALHNNSDDLEQVGRALYAQLNIAAVVIHPIDRCIAVTGDRVITEYGTVVEKPRISTGGGDNFNAGFCLGQMLGMELPDSMILGMATSGFYVKNGYSPSVEELAKHLKEL